MRWARPALLGGVLAVILIVGWSGIVKAGGSSPENAAASTATVAKVHAKLPPPRENDPVSARHKKQEKNPPPARHWPRIIMLGDSVMIGAEDNLAARLGPGFSMDAKVGRQADEFLEIVEAIKRQATTRRRW